LDSALDKSANQLEADYLFFRGGSQLPDLLHQRFCDRHFFDAQFVCPRRPGPKGVGGLELFKPDVLAGGRLNLGIEPPCSLARVVFKHPQYEVFDIGAYRAVETTGLIVQRE
jgi:hypothetical protein